jgi:hypothetical protein
VFKNAPVAVVPHWVRSMDAPAEYSPKSQRERRVVSIRVVPLLCCKGSNCVQCGEPIQLYYLDDSVPVTYCHLSFRAFHEPIADSNSLCK